MMEDPKNSSYSKRQFGQSKTISTIHNPRENDTECKDREFKSTFHGNQVKKIHDFRKNGIESKNKDGGFESPKSFLEKKYNAHLKRRDGDGEVIFTTKIQEDLFAIGTDLGQPLLMKGIADFTKNKKYRPKILVDYLVELANEEDEAPTYDPDENRNFIEAIINKASTEEKPNQKEVKVYVYFDFLENKGKGELISIEEIKDDNDEDKNLQKILTEINYDDFGKDEKIGTRSEIRLLKDAGFNLHKDKYGLYLSK